MRRLYFSFCNPLDGCCEKPFIAEIAYAANPLALVRANDQGRCVIACKELANMGEEMRVHVDHHAAKRAARPTPMIRAVRKSRAASARSVMFFIRWPF